MQQENGLHMKRRDFFKRFAGCTALGLFPGIFGNHFKGAVERDNKEEWHKALDDPVELKQTDKIVAGERLDPWDMVYFDWVNGKVYKCK